jgi:hypothetical protein
MPRARPKFIRSFAGAASSSCSFFHIYSRINFWNQKYNIVFCTIYIQCLFPSGYISIFLLVTCERRSSARNYSSSLPLPSLQSPPPSHRNLIPITAKVAPSFAGRVGGVMMTRYLRGKRSVMQKSGWWRWQRQLSLKIYILILKIPFWFYLICINVNADA